MAFPVIIFCLIISTLAFAQQLPDFISKDKRVVYGRVGDGFPELIAMKGTIIDMDFSEVECGGISTAGTLTIRPDTKIENYESEFVYLLVFCAKASDRKKYLGRKIEIAATKLVKFPFTSSVIVSNKFDSMGVPFYLARGGGFGELAKFLR